MFIALCVEFDLISGATLRCALFWSNSQYVSQRCFFCLLWGKREINVFQHQFLILNNDFQFSKLVILCKFRSKLTYFVYLIGQ